MAADSKTIDQLPTKDTLNNGDFIPVDDGEQTYKVLFSTIIASVPGVTGIALSEDGQSIVVTIRGQQNPVTITTHDNTKQNVLNFDPQPTENSNNPVKSGGVYAADAALANAILLEAQTARASENALQGRMYTAEGNITSLGTAVDAINNTSLPAKMDKSVYDSNGDGVVDNAKKVNNHTVDKDVPSNAVFTDTVYDDTAVRGLISTLNTALGNVSDLQTDDTSNMVNALNGVDEAVKDMNTDLEMFAGSETILDSDGNEILDSSDARILDTCLGARGIAITLNNVLAFFRETLSHLIQDSGYTETQSLYELINS